MKIPLNQFEEYIVDNILKRGLGYFKNGNVNPPEEISPGYFESLVKGTKDYIVHLRILNGIITDCNCTCPYDVGPICKHIAGVIFYLQQEELNIKPNPKKEKHEKQISKKKTVNEKVSDILDRLSFDDLKNYISEQCQEDSTFRQSFMLGFAHLNEKESKEFYAKNVKVILNSGKDRDGFIKWSSVRNVSRNINELLIVGNKHFEDKNFMSAIYVNCAVLEELTKALQFSDDSSGLFGSDINIAFESLFNIASTKIPEEIRSYLLTYCFDAYEKEFYSGWDWHIGMLEIASVLIKTDQDEKKIFGYLDKVQKSQFENGRAKEIKLNIILKRKGEQEADNFIEQNLDFSFFRNITIEKLVKSGNFEKAVKLAFEGIKKDVKSAPGLVNGWYKWLLKIAVLRDDKKEIIKYALFLFNNSNDNREEHYTLMKKSIEQKEWGKFIEQTIINIQKSKWFDFERLAFIFIKEEMWQELLKMLEKASSVHYLENYAKYLPIEFYSELADIYEKSIKEFLKINVSRDNYKIACRFIRKMKKLDVKNKTELLMDELRDTYKRRSALLNELDKI